MVEENGIPPTVLVIDDEVAVATLISQVLDNAGFRAEIATSGVEGLDKAASMRPDAVIVDIMMPEMNGHKVCQRLRSDPRTCRAAILVLTARGQPIDRAMALRVGADAHMPKPFKGKALVQEIHRLLAEGQLGAPLGYQIPVLRLREGVGATTLAVNLALCLAKQVGHLSAVLDIAQQGEQVRDHLGLSQPQSSLDARVLDADGVAAQLLRHESGLFVLSTPSGLHETEPVDPSVVSQVLEMLRSWHDYLVVDTPQDLGPLATVLLESPLILLVLTPDPATLQLAHRTVATFGKLGYRSLEVWPVLNMVSPEHQAFRVQVEQKMGLPVAAVLPWAPKVCEQAMVDGEPVVLSDPESELAAAVQALAHRIVRKVAAETREELPK